MSLLKLRHPLKENLLIPEECTIRDALLRMDQNALGLAIVIDLERRCVGLLTDGDIRRGLLRGLTLQSPISGALRKDFVALSVDCSETVIRESLTQKIRFIPLLDAERRPVEFVSWYDYHRIPLVEPSLTGNELSYVEECVKTNWISSQGRFVELFERQFTEYFGMPYAVAVTNGTVAIHLALLALGIGEGDEVLVPDFTFAATINAILHARATPVLCDVDPVTWTLDPESVNQAITKRTKAILPVHLYGQPCAMEQLEQIASEKNLLLVEDCAEALGSRYQKRWVGTFGQASTFSFFGNKTLTTGEGGMVLFKDESSYQRALSLRDHGMSKQKRYWHEVVGYNYRMTNLVAAIGVAQMEKIDQIFSLKGRIASEYNTQLANVSGLTLAPQSADSENLCWLYTVLLNSQASVSRDQLMEILQVNNIDVRRVFYPLHKMPIYHEFSKGKRFPVSESLSERGLSLPSALSLSASDIHYICNTLSKALGSKAPRESLVEVGLSAA